MLASCGTMYTVSGTQLKLPTIDCRRTFRRSPIVGCASLLTTVRSSLGLLFSHTWVAQITIKGNSSSNGEEMSGEDVA